MTDCLVVLDPSPFQNQEKLIFHHLKIDSRAFFVKPLWIALFFFLKLFYKVRRFITHGSLSNNYLYCSIFSPQSPSKIGGFFYQQYFSIFFLQSLLSQEVFFIDNIFAFTLSFLQGQKVFCINKSTGFLPFLLIRLEGFLPYYK